MSDTASIHALIRRGRRRLRVQRALDGAALAAIPAAAIGLALAYLVRRGDLGETAGAWLIAVALLAIVGLGALVAAARSISTQLVATRIDRASGLAGRLEAACAFEVELARPGAAPAPVDDETRAMMRAAIADAIAHADRADVGAATAFRAPPDARAAAAFAAVALAIGLLAPEGARDRPLFSTRAQVAAAGGLDPDERVVIPEDDLGFARDLVVDLRQTATDMQDAELAAFADKVEALLDQAERGEISKEQLLDELARAEQAYNEGASPAEVDRAVAELEKTGKELAKEPVTKELGQALQDGDLAKAQEEMKQLADKLAKGELGEKERAQAARALDKAAEAFDQREQAEQASLDKQIAKAKAEQQKAEAARDAATDPVDKQQKAAKAEERRKKTEALEKQKGEREASEQARTLKRLHRNMKKAAEEMQQDQASPESRRQSSRTMEDMARDTGKVDADKRKMAHQQKTQSQLDDLREAMRRAKKGGSKQPDRFGRNKRNQDFARRARGGRGSRTAWQRGQQGKQPGGQQPGGQGQQPGGDQAGDGTDPDLMGEKTAKSGKTKDEDLQGLHGKGPSTRETILSAAQKGFSSRSYREVYGKYQAKVEEVIRAEKVPSGYKFYVKKYFQKIKPHAM
jgi:hypothetical protein